MTGHTPRSRCHSWTYWLGVAIVLAVGLGGSTAPAQDSPLQPSAEGEGVHSTISIDLKGLDILDVLKLFSQKSGLSFVAGRNVSGHVTLFLKDVDLWDAFEIIVAANDLAYERHDNLINVMTARDYELLYGERFGDRREVRILHLTHAKAAPAATLLNQLKSTIGRVVVDEPSNTVILIDAPATINQMAAILTQIDTPVERRTYSLLYGTVETLKPEIEPLLTPGLGTASFDARTNQVIITDRPEVLETVGQLISAFGEKTPQVLIEAKILEVTLNNQLQLGVDWTAVMAGVDAETRANFKPLSPVIGGTATGAELKIFETATNHITLLVQALRKFTDTEIVASPRLLVTNRQEARFAVATREAYVTQTTTTPASGPVTTAEQISFVDVGTILTVTPTLLPNGFIQFKIKPERSSVSTTLATAGGNKIPIVKTSEVETTVIIKNEATLIIAGLIEDRDERADSRIPVLGDIPLFGAPFRTQDSTKKKTETIFFLTPTIVEGNEDLLGPSAADQAAVERAKQFLRPSPVAGSAPPSGARDTNPARR